MEKLTIQINENEYEAAILNNDSNEILINGKPKKIELLSKIDENVWSVSIDNTVSIVEFDYDPSGDAKVFIDGFQFDVKINDPLRLQLKKFIKAKDSEGKSGITKIKAPMPGLIVKVLCKEGDKVQKGDNIVIIEAMKMENAMKSPVDGTISKIFVKEAEAVEKDFVLIEISQ